MTAEQYEKAKKIEARKNHVIALFDLIIGIRDDKRNVVVQDPCALRNIVLDDDDVGMILDAIHAEIENLDNDFERI